MSTRKKILSGVTTLLYVLLASFIILQLLVLITVQLSDFSRESYAIISITVVTVIGFFGAHYVAKKYISKFVYKSPNRSSIISTAILAVIVFAFWGVYPTLHAKGGSDDMEMFNTLAYMERMAFIPVAILKGILDGLEALDEESTTS